MQARVTQLEEDEASATTSNKRKRVKARREALAEVKLAFRLNHGIFTALMTAVQDHCLEVLDFPLVVGVVEASNIASSRALKALGYKLLGDNYILKLFGVNLFSLVTWRSDRKPELHFVLKNAKGRSL